MRTASPTAAQLRVLRAIVQNRSPAGAPATARAECAANGWLDERTGLLTFSGVRVAAEHLRASDFYLPQDTAQQRAILRQCVAARRTRALFGPGCRVQGAPGREGTVKRHVPHTSSQGGSLTVAWDTGHKGSVSPMAVTRLAAT